MLDVCMHNSKTECMYNVKFAKPTSLVQIESDLLLISLLDCKRKRAQTMFQRNEEIS